MALIRIPAIARPIPIAEIAFTAASLVPDSRPGRRNLWSRYLGLDGPQRRVANACAPCAHGLGDLLRRLHDDDLRPGGERDVSVGAGLDGHDQVVVQQERLVGVAES